MELRCESKLHGITTDDGFVEVKCNSRFCGAGPGVVVLHKFDLHTGAVKTTRYREPPTAGRGDGTSVNRPSLRTA